jgi:hypothetical protein
MYSFLDLFCFEASLSIFSNTRSELVDRVIVVSHGSLLGGDEMYKVLQAVALLESAGLELPSIARLFTKLKTLGLVNDVPITYEEALNLL